MERKTGSLVTRISIYRMSLLKRKILLGYNFFPVVSSEGELIVLSYILIQERTLYDHQKNSYTQTQSCVLKDSPCTLWIPMVVPSV